VSVRIEHNRSCTVISGGTTVCMPVSKAMYGMSKSGMEALKRNFDASAGIALPSLWKQDENKRTYVR